MSTFVIFLTLPPSPPLKVKGRSETTVYHRVTPFPLFLRGRVGDRVKFKIGIGLGSYYSRDVVSLASQP